MIARWIDLCARNRFLVFTGTLLLVLAGIWAERRMPLDALPDISDVQVIIHTAWNEPPNVIEDQVTYPIVTALLAAPRVKAVRAQTMFGDSYVFVVFEDDTDLYWARSRVLEYLQQIAGRLRLPLALAHPQRLSLQKKPCWRASKIVPTSKRRAKNGPPHASRACSLSRIGWFSWTRPERQPR